MDYKCQYSVEIVRDLVLATCLRWHVGGPLRPHLACHSSGPLMHMEVSFWSAQMCTILVLRVVSGETPCFTAAMANSGAQHIENVIWE